MDIQSAIKTLSCTETGKAETSYSVFITKGLNMNKNFNLYSSKMPNESLPNLEPLSAIVESEIENIGHIVFALIGYIQEGVVLSEKFQHANITEIVWDSARNDLFFIDGSTLCINDANNEDSLWRSLTNYCDQSGIEYNEDKLKQEFGSVLLKLQKKAEARLQLPDKKDKKWQGLTDAIVKELKKQRIDYGVALSKCKGNPDLDSNAFNQLLRISYNFASDALPYLRLIISICDLKPIVLWGTIGEHYLLSEAFRSLPWARAKHKESLKGYRDIIGDARNKAFHNIFPFQKSLILALPPGSLQNAELRFFTEYGGRKNGNMLSFQDKELVDILLEFTRARHFLAAADFWERNISVMDRMIDLFEATSRILKNIYTIRVSND